ncbi:recombination protein RecR [Natronospira proteinivora]|uniref:Recombination protein RecR n=1 Tax=Natronospira proteinivora TaxID=1807133 RepID=A0ABT1G6C0_9GAMM|nr:recombination mediator RecR [Natronospira proteinivora]MCP1726490.1 recombination protein RecR [Natronospira proteinivora]
MFSRHVDALIDAFRVLPGVGPRSAQRMTFHLLERDREGGQGLVEALQRALEHVGQCRQCRMLSDEDICGICRSERRDASLLCVVESPADVMAIEQATDYRGRYFVLMGHFSPLDGIGPDELGLDLLEQRLDSGEVAEMILATNPTVEGEATASYLMDMARSRNVRSSRIAHGVPIGGELEYVDGGTLSHAFQGRLEIK